MIALTSFSQSGYTEYAHQFVETKDKWPTDIIIYTESPLGLENERDFFSIPNVRTFLQYLKHWPLSRGITDKGYNYNFNLWKFCRKVFCQWDVLKDYKGKVFWLDADIIFKKDISEDYLEKLFNGKGIVTFQRPGFHSETGFVGFDTEHPKFKAFLDAYIGYLQKGTFLNFPRWHDCELLDQAIKETGIPVEDLTENWETKPKYTIDDLNVFARSRLSEYMEHKKGAQKNKL